MPVKPIPIVALTKLVQVERFHQRTPVRSVKVASSVLEQAGLGEVISVEGEARFTRPLEVTKWITSLEVSAYSLNPNERTLLLEWWS